MAGRFGKVGGVIEKVNKRHGKVAAVIQPVKKRYDKAGGVWQPSFSAEPTYNVEVTRYAYSGNVYGDVYSGGGNDIVSKLTGPNTYSGSYIENNITFHFAEAIQFTSFTRAAYLSADSGASDMYPNWLEILYGGNDTGDSYTNQMITDGAQGDIITKTQSTTTFTYTTPATYHVIICHKRKQNSNIIDTVHFTLQLTTADGRSFMVHM